MAFVFRAFLAGILVSMMVDTAGAQTYPTKQVRILVPFAAGGAVDAMARTLAKPLGAKWGRQLVVENRPGAGGTIASQALAQSPPDGHSLILITSAHSINQFFYPKLPYDTFKDFTPIGQVASSTLAVVVGKDSKFRSFKDVLAEARAKPGTLSYGIAGIGTSAHLAGELINHMAGVKTVAVPYRGGAPALTAVIAGEIPMSINPMAEIVGQLDSGTVRALAVTTAKRSPVLPNLPTIAEEGIAGYDAAIWWGLLAPAGVPLEIVAKIHESVLEALKDPAVLDYLNKTGAAPAGSGPKEFEALMRADADKWEPILKAANIRPE